MYIRLGVYMFERHFTPYEVTSAVIGNRIAILAPHPDDEVFGCGGSARKWSNEGKRVQAFIITSGVLPDECLEESRDIKRSNKIALRANESRAAAKVLNLPEPEFFGRQDGALLNDKDIEELLFERLQSWMPTTLVVPSIWEMHRDHRATSELGLSLAKRLDSVRRIAFYEVGVPLVPNCLEDITQCQELKWLAMNQFASQLQVQDYAEQIRGLNKFRSYTLGMEVHYAEAFYTVDKSEFKRFCETSGLSRTTQVLMAAEKERQKDQQLMTQSQQRIHELESTLEQMHQSHSWRITQPLRWLRKVLKKIK